MHNYSVQSRYIRERYKTEIPFFFVLALKQYVTLRWVIVIRVGVALCAVLHQETGTVPGHADDAI